MKISNRFVRRAILAVVVTGLVACSSPEEKAAEYIESGDEYFQQGDYVKAALEYRNALQINENLPEAIYGLALIAEHDKDWRRMFGLLTKIQELNPNHLDARLKLAHLYLATSQIMVALEEARALMELLPDDSRTHSLMAAVHYRLGNLEDGLAEVERALALDLDNSEAALVRARIFIDQQKYDPAGSTLDGALTRDPENISLYLMKIQLFEAMNQIDQTTEVLRELAARFPENKQFQYALARNYQRNGDLASTERIYRDIIQREPDNHEEKLRLVVFIRQSQSLDAAVAQLKQYIEQHPGETRFQFALAELYESGVQAGEAVDVYRQIVEADGLKPDGLEARNKIALLEIRQGNLETARQLIDEVLANDRESENALMLLAGLQINEGNFDGAIVGLRTVLRNNPDAIRAHALLGRAYALNGSTELAVDAYTNGYRISPGSAIIVNGLAELLMRQRKFQQVDEVLSNSIGSGNRSVESLVTLTQAKLALQQWDEAESLANQLGKIEGEQARSEQILGLVYQGRDQQEESISAFKRAHDLAPESAQPVISLVRAQVRSGKIDEARNFLNSILAVSSDNVVAHLLLGQLNVLESRLQQAEIHFRKVVELRSDAVNGYRALALLYLRQNNETRAIEVLRQGLAKIPGNPFLTISLASVYERQERFEDAIDLYEALLDENDRLIIARNNLASMLTDHRSDQESHDRARLMASRLKDSQVPQFRDTYAWAAVRSGINLEEAVAILEGIVRENEQVDIYSYHLGEAYRKQGDTEKAIVYLSRAESLAAEDSDLARKARASLDELSR